MSPEVRSIVVCIVVFQIPMRGNEVMLKEDQYGEAWGFQIPMRGNESQDWCDMRCASSVSNPHEG